MYVLAFATAYMFLLKVLKEDKSLERESAEDLFFWIVIGLLAGARIASCFLYDDAHFYLTNPWYIFWPFRNGQFTGLPGMSYHGGVVGGLLGAYIYCKVKKLDFLKYADAVAATIPFAYTWGRLGNFINGELYGRVTTSSIGMVFPAAERFSTTHAWVREFCDAIGLPYVPGDYVNLPRWPSQLFEAFFEGIVLGVIIWFVVKGLKKRKNLADGVILGSYIAGYGIIRFILEYFRQPDWDIGYVIGDSANIYLFESLGNISKGQVYCALMVGGGALIIAVASITKKRKQK